MSTDTPEPAELPHGGTVRLPWADGYVTVDTDQLDRAVALVFEYGVTSRAAQILARSYPKIVVRYDDDDGWASRRDPVVVLLMSAERLVNQDSAVAP